MIKVKVMIDGAPVTQSYADEIGAVGYAPDAASAVDKAKKLLEKDFLDRFLFHKDKSIP